MTEYQEGRERWWYYPGRDRSQPRSQGSFLQADRTWERSWVGVSTASKRILGDPGAATILVINHSFPMLIWVLQWFQCFKIRVAQHWGGRGHIAVRTKVSGVKISRIFQKIQEKRCLFQRFVPSIVVGPLGLLVCSNHHELIPKTVVICVNPFSHKSDQY